MEYYITKLKHKNHKNFIEFLKVKEDKLFIEYVNMRTQKAIEAKKKGNAFYSLEELQREYA